MGAVDIFPLLADAPFGAYAVSLDRTIVFWNREAERILGFAPERAVGRRCYEVVAGLQPGGLAPSCLGECPSLRDFREGEIPPSVDMQMLCESGERKLLSLTSLIAVLPAGGAPVLIHIFDEDPLSDGSAEGARGGSLGQGVDIRPGRPATEAAAAGSSPLTARETEVLRLVALGRGTEEIADDLAISPHTVRNHVRHLRRRLGAKSKLQAVVAAIRLGILTEV